MSHVVEYKNLSLQSSPDTTPGPLDDYRKLGTANTFRTVLYSEFLFAASMNFQSPDEVEENLFLFGSENTKLPPF